jgi:hypothetical protein
MNKAIATRPEVGCIPADLEGVLSWLQKFGRPRLSCLGTGWHSNIEMHVSSVGAEFKVASEFGHPTPLAAAQECAARVVQTLRDLGAA